MAQRDSESGTPKRPAMLPYGRQWLDEEDKAAVMKVLNSDFLTQGPTIAAFERGVADAVGARYAVAFSNGTAALHAACFAAGIGPGDEVITSPITFLASSNCVLYMGGKPVFADIKPDTYNIDPDRIEAAITSRTRAIIPVDFTGQPAEMDRIMDIARKHGLVVIEDAAHSLGASYGGRMVGSIADMTMFSFHPVKHITSGEGGMIVTDNESYYRKLQLFRNHGMTRDHDEMEQNEGPWYYEMQALGFNYRMTDLQAALGLTQLGKLDKFVGLRRDIARTYTEAFSDIPGVIVPFQHPKANSSWHLYVLRFELNLIGKSRQEIFNDLRSANIGVNVHYIPIYRQPYYRSLGYSNIGTSQAERYYETAISLPLFPQMSGSDLMDVLNAVKRSVEL